MENKKYIYYSVKDIPVKLGNGTNIFENIFIYDNNKNFIDNSTFLSPMKFDLNLNFDEKIIIDDISFLYYSNWAGKAYVHYIEECLPKLNLYLRLKEKYKNIKLIIPEARYVEDIKFLIKNFNINVNNLLILEDKKLYFFENLLLSKHYKVNEEDSDQIEIINKIRGILKIKKNINPSRNVYIKRSTSIDIKTGNYNIGKTRTILNEDILIKYLLENNFEILETGSLTLEEKQEKLKNSNIIITQTGGSSYNLLFTNTPKKLIFLSNDTPVAFDSCKKYLTDKILNFTNLDIILLKYKSLKPKIDKENITNSPFKINLNDIKKLINN